MSDSDEKCQKLHICKLRPGKREFTLNVSAEQNKNEMEELIKDIEKMTGANTKEIKETLEKTAGEAKPNPDGKKIDVDSIRFSLFMGMGQGEFMAYAMLPVFDGKVH